VISTQARPACAEMLPSSNFPVAFPTMTDEPNILDRAQVGELIGKGVTEETVKQYQKDSKPGGRYEDNPFPKEDGYFVQSPYWLKSSIPKILAWDAARSRPGVGGRPRSKD